jgi:hypothetical protein
MIWNDQAFDHLVYDEQQKDLVLSFVENHNKAGGEPAMRDVIRGKGETPAGTETGSPSCFSIRMTDMYIQELA